MLLCDVHWFVYIYSSMNVEGKHSAIFNECNLIQPDVRSGSELASIEDGFNAVQLPLDRSRALDM